MIRVPDVPAIGGWIGVASRPNIGAMFNNAHIRLSEALAGDVVLPLDARWDQARSSFNLLLDQHPEGVVFPADERDVAAAVDYAKRSGLRVAPQATGHNQGPLGDLEGMLLVNVSALQDVRVDPAARRVRVGAGVKWDRVALRLSAHGLAGLHGSSPDVGIAGYSLGGGMGWLARKHGLQSNAVTALELVTADGKLRRVDAGHEPELFWALRGGGGNFGVVTAIEFSVVPVDELYAGAMFFPFERSADLLHTWTAMLAALPDELMSWVTLMHFPPIPDVPAYARGRSFAVVMAAFLGGEPEGRALLSPLRELGPVKDTLATVPPVVLANLAMDPYDPLPHRSTTHLLDALPGGAIDDLLDRVGPDSDRGTELTMLNLRHMGGALARKEPGAGARATLPGEISVYGAGVVLDGDMDAAVASALGDVDRALSAHRAGDYGNFVEEPADASAFYDAETWTRLRAAKASYDPEDLFAGNHHIPPEA